MELRTFLEFGPAPKCIQMYLNSEIKIVFDFAGEKNATSLDVLTYFRKNDVIPCGVYIVKYADSSLSVTIPSTETLFSRNFYPKEGRMEIHILRLPSERYILSKDDLIFVSPEGVSSLTQEEAQNKPELFSYQLEDFWCYKVAKNIGEKALLSLQEAIKEEKYKSLLAQASCTSAILRPPLSADQRQTVFKKETFWIPCSLRCSSYWGENFLPFKPSYLVIDITSFDSFVMERYLVKSLGCTIPPSQEEIMLEVAIEKKSFSVSFKIERRDFPNMNLSLGLRDIKRLGMRLDLAKEEVTFAGESGEGRLPPTRLVSDQEIAQIKYAA